MDKKIKIEFAPGCFDNFEGTQEELDKLIAEIHAGIESGEFLSKAQPLDLDALIEEDPEFAEKILAQLDQIDPESVAPKRTLN